MNPNASLKHRKGFTLLEVLIALFIFTIVSTIMVSGLRTVLNSQAALEKQAARFSALQMALLVLSRDIEQAIYRLSTNGKGAVEPSFMGAPNQILLIHTGLANPLGQLQRSTLQRTQYSWEKKQLIRETWPVLDQVAKTISSERILLDNVSSLRFEFLDEEGRFHDHWPPPENRQVPLPRAVRVSLSLTNWGKIEQLYLLPTRGTDNVKP